MRLRQVREGLKEGSSRIGGTVSCLPSQWVCDLAAERRKILAHGASRGLRIAPRQSAPVGAKERRETDSLRPSRAGCCRSPLTHGSRRGLDSGAPTGLLIRFPLIREDPQKRDGNRSLTVAALFGWRGSLSLVRNAGKCSSMGGCCDGRQGKGEAMPSSYNARMSPSRCTCRSLFLVALLTLVAQPSAAHAQKMYFAAYDNIFRANLDGTNIECLLNFLLSGSSCQPWGIALDVPAGKMYWTDYLLKRLRRANLDGTGMEDLDITCVGSPTAIALDLSGGKLYWAEKLTQGDDVAIGGTIRRADLGGGEAETLLDGFAIDAIALDIGRGKLYWVAETVVGRANLDGSEIERLVDTPSVTRTGLAFDPTAAEVYIATGRGDGFHIWAVGPNGFGARGTHPNATAPPGTIQHVGIDSTPIPWPMREVPGLPTIGCVRPGGVALDISDGRVYWTCTCPGKWSHDTGVPQTRCSVRIQRSRLDGSEVEDLVYGEGICVVNGIALDLTPTREAGLVGHIGKTPFALAGGCGLAAIGTILLCRRGLRRRRQSGRAVSGHVAAAIPEKTYGRSGRRLRKAGICTCALLFGLWISSTLVTVFYMGWGFSVGLGGGEFRLDLKKQPPPADMKGRLVSWFVQPGFEWRRLKGWSNALAKPTWQNWSFALGLSLPRREKYASTTRLVTPLWLPTALVAATTVFLIWRDRRRKPPGHCRSCGYNLTGNVSGICPECGVAVDESSANNPQAP